MRSQRISFNLIKKVKCHKAVKSNHFLVNEFSRDMLCINFRNKGWKRILGSWSFWLIFLSFCQYSSPEAVLGLHRLHPLKYLLLIICFLLHNWSARVWKNETLRATGHWSRLGNIHQIHDYDYILVTRTFFHFLGVLFQSSVGSTAFSYRGLLFTVMADLQNIAAYQRFVENSW